MRNYVFHIFPGILVAMLLVLTGIIWYRADSLETAFLSKIHKELHERAGLVELYLTPLIREKSPLLDSEIRRLGKTGDLRITIINADGKVLHDTEEEPAKLENHLNRPEVMEALRGEPGATLRFSDTMRQNQLYAAGLIQSKDGQKYIVRVGISIQTLNDLLFYARRDIILMGVFIALVMGVIGLIWIRRTNHPLDKIRRQARRIAGGDLRLHLPIPPSNRRIREMAEALNRMSNDLIRQIFQLRADKSKRDVIFSSMSEGVIAIDHSGIIIDINPAAMRMLELPTLAEGLSLKGVVRCIELQDFVTRLLKERQPMSLDLTLTYQTVKYLRVRGAMLKSGENAAAGAVLVISDMTRLRQLENFRSDFIADVSHEIKTPLTAINGAVEALQDGAINDPEGAARFMAMISRQTERMNNLVKDILSISALEHHSGEVGRDFATINLSTILHNAVELARVKAAEQQVELLEEAPPEVLVKGDPQLLEQAVFNLIDNALKYSQGTQIQIVLQASAGQAELRVADNGCGIPLEHLARIFERFYRVDKARSRKLGGTGLGLSIVKHTAQHHGGTVRAESTVGKGSTFTIRLPLA